jgi:Tfp pilus assembly protein FimV
VIVPAETAAPSPARAPAPRTIRVVAGATSGQSKAGDRVHVVRRGESLWSIASDLLGEDASTARVAREVSRLWELNENRIATGSPDLLFSGTRLRLR